MEVANYTESYSAGSFWAKIGGCFKKAGRHVIEKALWLYYAAENPETPAHAKATIYAALGYLIMPFDAIPDFTPVFGYSDDLAVLAAAVAIVSMYIDEDVKAKTARKLRIWFGS